MKFIEKITLIIYSNIMLILSIILCLLVFGWLDIQVVKNIISMKYYICIWIFPTVPKKVRKTEYSIIP